MKKNLCFALVIMLALITGSIHTYAYNFPTEFDRVNPYYDEALDNGDLHGIVEYGSQVIDIMSNEPDCDEVRVTLVTRTCEVAKAYAELGDFENSLLYYRRLYDLTVNHTDQYKLQLYEADLAIRHYSNTLELYTDGGVSPNYGAKNEKGNGVLFGLCADGKARSSTGHESMVLTYQELGQKLLEYNRGVMRNASSTGLAVEFALNCPKQGADIRNINSMKSYLKEISELFADYPKVPVYLRFAAEFDVWANNPVYPDEFVSAFRYVSDYFKSRNKNVAVVWCPTHAPAYNLDIDDYYPGDEYVDWVGISSYAAKYHDGNPNQSEVNSLFFKSGNNSSPVAAISRIVDTYGDRKPIMICESGSGHTVKSLHENTTEFALYRLQEYYTYVPMVYPQVKLIAHFDQYINGADDDFRLSSNSTMLNEYVRLTRGSRFIQDKYSGETGFCYQHLFDGLSVNNVFPVSAYAQVYGERIEQVTYFIDGNYKAVSAEMPFTVYIDAREMSGTHTLKAVAAAENGKTITKEARINIRSGDTRNISVEVSGDEISFDQEPVLYNDRTMVPMRKIFEELGAKVTWDDHTRTATGKKGDRAVKVTLDSKTMFVNSKAIELDTPPILMSDRTLVPVRAVAEGLGCDVEWNDRKAKVYIEPKVFKWSDWDEDLPSYVNDDLYYIEEKDEYKYREREYYETERYNGTRHLVDEEIDYGSWSDWQRDKIRETDDLDVEVRTQSEPKKYFYAHYCTGNIGDSDNRYKTSSGKWHDECLYHELGWYDYLLDRAPDGKSGYVVYRDDGNFYRCGNTCYRWYILDETGGDYTEYRSRPIYHTYTYWEWSDWSDYDDWCPDEDDDDYDIEERTVYRFKEK